MKPKDRQLAAIRHEQTDRISIDAINVENAAAIAEYLGIPEASVYDRLGIDGKIIVPPYTGPDRTAPNGGEGNDWGSSAIEEYGNSSLYPFSLDSGVSEVEKYMWPDPSWYDYTGILDRMRGLGETYAVRGPYWRPIFCSVCSLMGIEDAMVAMIRRSALFEALLERVAYINFEYCKRMIDESGDLLDIFCLGDEFATQRGLLISPGLWRQYLKPVYRKIFGYAKKRHKPVWFHSCGDITEILPDLIDIGMDVWETVQLHTLPLSAQELKRKYGGEITFFGGINTQNLPFTDVESIKREVENCVRVLGKGGGYICGPDHHIKPDVSVEQTLALFDTAQSVKP